jgi:hypothetical protein
MTALMRRCAPASSPAEPPLLAANRAPEGRQATAEDIAAVALTEFALLLDARQASAALRESTLRRG